MAPSAFPPARTVRANGISLAVHEQGSGFPVVFSHGFPELAYSWRHQLPAVAAAGFRAIALDQRGYGASDCPAAVEAYGIRELTGDLVGLLDALGLERAVFVGHDWGGLVVWMLPLLHPGRIAGIVGVNTPFLPRSPMPPVDMLRAMFGPDHYIVWFQNPGEADAALARDVRRTFEMFMRCGVDRATAEKRLAERGGAISLREALASSEPLPGRALLTPEELDVFVSAFERTGFTGGINWYRNMNRNWEITADLPQKIELPALMITAEDDLALRPELADGMEARVPDLARHLVRRCGHWTQQEHPDEVNRVLVDWLKKRFPR
jgi:pimeloyl-ACP methyl ester carboxylesterase